MKVLTTDFYLYIASTCHVVNPKERKDCGWSGITESQCESKGCCYDSSIPDAYNCFHKGIVFIISLCD